MKRNVFLFAALALMGAAAAASGAADAMSNASVAFYSGFPSSGGSLVVKATARAAEKDVAPKAVERSTSVVITVSGHAYTFPLDQAAKAKGQVALAVKGVLKASGHGSASVGSVVKELAEAQAGKQPLVVLSRAQGSGQVVVGFYHPNGGNAGLRVKNADRATVWVGGQPHTYAVKGDNGSGLMASIRLQASGGQRSLGSTVAGLQTQAALGASNGGSAGASGSGGGSARGSASGGAGLNVTVGGGK